MKYSIIIPIKNEEKNIPILDKEIKQVMDKLARAEDYETIYVNDGSADKSLQEMKKLRRVKIINLQRGYGQAIALDAGFKQAKGDIIISIDGDLQNDPRDIPRLLEKLERERLYVVAGWRRKRKDNGRVRLLTRIGRSFRRILISDPVHDTGCTLRVYRKKAIETLDLWGEMHRYLLALLRWKGFKIGELPVHHKKRIHGRTKYTTKKATRGFIDLIYIWFINKYSNRPLHLFGSMGLFSFFLGILMELYALHSRIVTKLSLNRNGWFFLGFFMIIMGIQFFISGIMLDLQIRTHFNTSQTEKRYIIKEVIETK